MGASFRPPTAPATRSRTAISASLVPTGPANGGGQDLYSATVPGGASTTYGYDSANPDRRFDHDILTEGLPTGGTVTNTYNSSGQVTSQDAPSADVTLTYSGNNQAVSGGSTIVSTWPAGTSGGLAAQVVDYQYSDGALVAETTGTAPREPPPSTSTLTPPRACPR